MTDLARIIENDENIDPETLSHNEYDFGRLFDAPNATSTASTSEGHNEEQSSPIPHDLWEPTEEFSDEMMIPYYEDDEDGDDDDDASCGAGAFHTRDIDSEYVVSGWGSECLQNIEDIDFEFVYALHTFMATVEGQANATKGDTMVLLDDSNSYWWLVRVVKDSSIGELCFVFMSPLLRSATFSRIAECVLRSTDQANSFYRLLAGRAHRDTDRAFSTTQQAQKH